VLLFFITYEATKAFGFFGDGNFCVTDLVVVHRDFFNIFAKQTEESSLLPINIFLKTV